MDSVFFGTESETQEIINQIAERKEIASAYLVDHFRTHTHYSLIHYSWIR